MNASNPEIKPEPQREAALFQAASQLTSAERAAFLNSACHGDPALRQRLEALLAAHDARDSFLEPQAPKPGSQPVNTIKIGVTDNPADDAVGRMVGHYKLLEKLGEGGCGAVYVAEQTAPVRRRVALKVIKLGMDTKAVIARFEAERQALAMMDHPNIAKVLDAGTTEAGRPYFVMELVRGIRITEYCDQNHLSTRERLDLFIKVCHAIQHAHQKGIIHRDIKPSNIMVTLHDGVPVPKVIDFGIAKATEGRLTDATVYTQLHQFVGTPAYISPEQAEMSGLDIDTRSDIYSLGVLLYELLIGSTPFDANELMASGIDGMRKMIREKEPVRPSTRLMTLQGDELTTMARRRASDAPKLVHLLKGDLDWIVMKCLEKDRTRRYETANGLASDLKRHLNNELVLARPPSAAYRFQKAFRRNKLVFAAAAAVGGVLVLGAIVSTWQAVRATHAKREALAAQTQAVQAEAKELKLRQQAETNELAARQLAYASDMNVAKQALDENNLGRTLFLLNRQRPQPGQKDLRGWEWRYLWQQCRSDASFTLCRQPSDISSLAVSPDGNWLAVGAHGRGGLSVRNIRTGQELIRLAESEEYIHAAFSPTEPLLAFTSSTYSASGMETDTLRLWNSTTRQMTGPFSLNRECIGLAFSKDGRRLVTSTTCFLPNGPKGRITLWRMPEGTELTNYPSEQARIGPSDGFAATPDLSLAAYAYGVPPSQRIRVVDLRDGKELWTTNASKECVTALAFSPDGKTLASGAGFAESDTDIRLWDVATGKEIGRLKGHGYWVSSLVFWPDGKKLASSSGDTIRIWDVPGTNTLDVLRGPDENALRLALLPDHTNLVSGGSDGKVCFWDTSVRHPHDARITLPGRMVAWNFAPDNQSVVTSEIGGRVTRWQGLDFQDSETLREIGTNRYPECDLFSSDGRLLAVTTSNNVLQVWDLSRRQLRRELPTQAYKIFPQSFSAGGNKLVTYSVNDNLLHEWNLTTGLEMQSWQAPVDFSSADEVSAICLSPDEGSCMAIDHLGSAVLRNLADQSQTKVHLDVPEVMGASFSPDGKLFAVVSTMGYARVWETATWREVATDLHGNHSVAFSGDGKRLAIGGTGKDAVSLYDTASWEKVLTLEGQGSVFLSTEFSPDGNAIGSMSTSGTVQLWRAPPWAEINAAEAAEKQGQHP